MFDAENWKLEEIEIPDIEPVRIIDSMHSPETDGMASKTYIITDGSMDVRERYDYVCVFREKNCEPGCSKSDRMKKTNYYIADRNLLDNGTHIQNIFRMMEDTHTGIAFSPLPIYFLQNGKHAENNSFWCTWEVFLELYRSDLLSDTRENLQRFAEQAGYKACVVMSDVYAGLQWNNLETILGRVAKNARKMSLSGNYKGLKSNIQHNCYDLIRFAQQYSRIAIYGTGAVADIITEFLCQRFFEIDFYIVSEGYRKEQFYGDKPVYELPEVHADEELGIVVALNKKNAEEAIRMLEERGFVNCIYLEGEFGV